MSSEVLTDIEIADLAGRMYECCNIHMAIEDGDLPTIESVLDWLVKRSTYLEGELRHGSVTLAGDVHESGIWKPCD